VLSRFTKFTKIMMQIPTQATGIYAIPMYLDPTSQLAAIAPSDSTHYVLYIWYSEMPWSIWSVESIDYTFDTIDLKLNFFQTEAFIIRFQIAICSFPLICSISCGDAARVRISSVVYCIFASSWCRPAVAMADDMPTGEHWPSRQVWPCSMVQRGVSRDSCQLRPSTFTSTNSEFCNGNHHGLDSWEKLVSHIRSCFG
jgi:hypothetical protein